MHITPMDGIVDGGEVYTEEELAIINKEEHTMKRTADYYTSLMEGLQRVNYLTKALGSIILPIELTKEADGSWAVKWTIPPIK